MIIETKTGKHRSKVTRRELQEDLRLRMSTLTPDERKYLIQILDEIMVAGDQVEESPPESQVDIENLSGLYRNLANLHYEREIVSVDHFIRSDEYMGNTGKSLYDQWLRDLNELYSRPYNEVIITGGIGTGKSCCKHSELYDISNGVRCTIGDVAGSSITIGSYDHFEHAVTPIKSEAYMSGYKKLGDCLLKSGKKIRCSADHPFLTPNGYSAIRDISYGDFIATVRWLPPPDQFFDISDEEVEFIAFMFADGSFEDWTFVKQNQSILGRFKNVSAFLSGSIGTCTLRKIKNNTERLYPKQTQWIRKKYNISVEKSINKRIPSEFYGLTDRQSALFLNRFFACDGHVSKMEIELTLANEGLLRDIRHLLLRLGIHSRVKEKTTNWTHKGIRKHGIAWRLLISSAGEQIKFFDRVGFLLGHEEACEKLYNKARSKKRNSNVDITPVTCEVSKRIRDEVGIPWKEWREKYRFPKGHYMGMDKLVEIEKQYGLPDWCSWWTDVFWDRLESFSEDSVISPVYDITVPRTENFVSDGIILHNSTMAEFGLAYTFYQICMLRDPQASFGLMEGSEIILVCFNRDDYLARNVTFGGLKKKIEISLFFKRMGLKISNSSIKFENKNIEIIAASAKSAKTLGRNVFGGIIDETDFIDGGSVLKDKDLATGEKSVIELLHTNIIRRMKSRFDRAGVLPGKLFMTSSAKSSDSFTNRRIGEASTDPMVFCRDYAQYEVKPADQFSKKRFWVRVGNERIPHKILSRKEYQALGRSGRAKLETNGCRFIRVPMNFKTDFERNIEDSIRDISGITTVSVMPFFQMRGRLYEMVDDTLVPPTRLTEWVQDEPLDINWKAITRKYRRRIGPGRYEEVVRPRRHPDAQRFAHIDLSRGVQDPTGIAIGHIVDHIQLSRRRKSGEEFLESLPLIEIDFVIRVVPASGKEIDFGEVRGLIYDFQRHGYAITFAAMDSFQGHSMLQELGKHGIDGEILSVDKTVEPYTDCKTAIYEGRVSVYSYPILLGELEKLRRNDMAKVKIDHPPNGTKDVSDAFCGVIYTLTTRQTMLGDISPGISEYKDRSDEDSEWIRSTMHKSGEKAPIEVKHDEDPIFFLG